MKDDRVDLEPLADWRARARADRVVGAVLEAASAGPAPRADLISAVLILGRPAVAVAAILAVAALAASAVPDEPGGGPVTVGGALGIPPTAERVIRGERAVDVQELLAVLGELQ